MARITVAAVPVFRRTWPRTPDTPSRTATRSHTSRPIGLAGVWRDTLATFSAHSVATLSCAFIGFALPMIAGHWAATQAVLRDHAWVGPIVTLYERPSLPLLLTQAIIALLASTFVRGVITWQTLNPHRACGQAFRMVLSRYPALLVGASVYAAYALACALLLSSLARGAQPDAYPATQLSAWTGPSRAWGDVSRHIAGQAINRLIPDHGSPIAVGLPALRSATSDQVTQYEQWLAETAGKSTLTQSRRLLPAHEEWFLAVAGLVLLILAEPLLRFVTVMAFKPSRSRQVPELPGGVGPRRFAALTALYDSVRFGLRYFGIVMRHIWVTRIVILALCLGLVELPLALMDAVILPNLVGMMGKSHLLVLLKFAQVSAAALVSALALAFGAVYDAQLARRLTA
jgi:hypothetical protein